MALRASLLASNRSLTNTRSSLTSNTYAMVWVWFGSLCRSDRGRTCTWFATEYGSRRHQAWCNGNLKDEHILYKLFRDPDLEPHVMGAMAIHVK